MFTIFISIFAIAAVLFALAPAANDSDSEGYQWGGSNGGDHAGSARSAFLSDDNDFNYGSSASSSSWSSWHDSGPSVNIDGTPMMGSIDINGNPYGVTESSWSNDSWSHHDSFSSFGSCSGSSSICGNDW